MAEIRGPITDPDLINVLEKAKRDVKTTLNCVKIGTIQSFDKDTQTASIKISHKQVISIDEDGVKTTKDYPLLLECPVMVLFGGVDFLSLPIEAGDSCIVLFSDRQIDNWLKSGDGTIPSVGRTHDISDGIAIVGIRPLTNSIQNYLENGIRLSHGGGTEKIDLTDGIIDTIADLFLHHGDMRIEGDLTIKGETYGNDDGEWIINADIIQEVGKEIHDGRRVSGTFDTVTVVDGIVVGGS